MLPWQWWITIVEWLFLIPIVSWQILRSRRRLSALREAQSSALSHLSSLQSMTGSGVSGAGPGLTGSPALLVYSHGSSKPNPELLALQKAALAQNDADLEMAHRAAMLFDSDERYRRTIELLLRAAGIEGNELVRMPYAHRLGMVVHINDSLKTDVEAREWFQRALELTY